MFDLTGLWKKIVLQGMDEKAGEEIHQTPVERQDTYIVPPTAGTKRRLPDDEQDVMDLDPSDSEDEGPSSSKRFRRSSPPVPNAWRAALW